MQLQLSHDLLLSLLDTGELWRSQRVAVESRLEIKYEHFIIGLLYIIAKWKMR